MKKILILSCAVLAVIALLLVFRGFKSAQGAQGRLGLLREVDGSTEFPIAVDPAEGAPVLIESASVKQIRGPLYRTLTRDLAAAGTDEYVSLPTYRIRNISNKTISDVGVLLYSQTGAAKSFGFIKTDLKIAPDETYTITRQVLVEFRANVQSRTPRGQNRFNRAPEPGGDFGDLAMWRKTIASDERLQLIHAIFTDGSYWKNPLAKR
jgi:hypothetical protein